MIRKTVIVLLLGLIIGLTNPSGADNLDDKIRAAGSDLKVFCPATDANNIQWTALLYLNQTYGAEIYVALFQPSPIFGCQKKSTGDGQFHLVTIGLGAAMDQKVLVDSMLDCVFGNEYPQLAIYGVGSSKDSLWLTWLLDEIRQISENDTTALSSLETVYLRGSMGAGKAVLLNDEELYRNYAEKSAAVSKSLEPYGPLDYKPERFRRYFLMTPLSTGRTAGGDFLSGEIFGLPNIIEERFHDGPEKKNTLRRLDSYRSAIGIAARPWISRSEKLKFMLAAYSDISSLNDMARAESSQLAESGIGGRVAAIKEKAFEAIEEIIGINWYGNLQIRQTPFGNTGKLSLDVDLTGPSEIELSYFRFHPPEAGTIIIDSISKTILPHQRFYREYPVDLTDLDFVGISDETVVFSIDVIVRGLTLTLSIPFTDYADEDVSIRFLPGYTFLTPFTEDQYTALAQPFDWQLLITKPYGSILDGRIKIVNPEGVVVGTFDNKVHIPEGITAKYLDIHFAAGRSIGYDLRKVKASLEVGGQIVARTEADVRVIRCDIPDTRDIAFVPDPEGRLEDFLRIKRASFQPFTPQSLIRAPLEAYDLLIIGSDAESYHEILRKVGDRLHEFVSNGGEILILGQSFGWPYDIFSFPIYTSKVLTPVPAQLVDNNHPIISEPYDINSNKLLARMSATTTASPAIISGGTEIVAAGEPGSYLKVLSIGDGHIIYCGLPLLEMAAELDVEAIHLIANLLNFGHGNR